MRTNGERHEDKATAAHGNSLLAAPQARLRMQSPPLPCGGCALARPRDGRWLYSSLVFAAAALLAACTAEKPPERVEPATSAGAAQEEPVAAPLARMERPASTTAAAGAAGDSTMKTGEAAKGAAAPPAAPEEQGKPAVEMPPPAALAPAEAPAPDRDVRETPPADSSSETSAPPGQPETDVRGQAEVEPSQVPAELAEVPVMTMPTNPAKVDPEKARKVFDEASGFIQTGKLNKATELLEEWLKATPDDLTNRRNLAHIYLLLSKLEEAELHLKFLADRLPDQAEWWGHLARVQVRLGKYSQAVQSMEKARELAPEDVGLILDLARIHGTRRDYKSAAKVLEAALPLGQRTEEILKELSAARIELGEYGTAQDALLKLQRLKPEYANALMIAGLAAKADKCAEVQDALAGWEKDFSDEKPFLFLGACALKENEAALAQKHYRAALAKNKECYECLLKLGDLSFLAQKWPEAADLYGQAAPLSPKDHRAFVQLGKSLANAGKHIEASRAFAAADERNPGEAETVYMLGVELVLSGQKGEAWKVWGQLDELDKPRARALRKLLTE